MGKLIDADVLREEVYSWGMNDYEPSDFTDAIDDALPVEAIPKDQYEARLRADMVAMLTELQQEIDEKATELCDDGWWLTYNDIIQQKIDALKVENKMN